MRNYSPEQLKSYFIDLLLYHEIDRQLRQQITEALIPLGIHLWGDEGWLPLEEKGARYHGFANDPEKLSSVLSSSKICLNIQRRITDGINMRTFEATAHGALLMAQRSPLLSELYEPDKEFIGYSSPNEAKDKAKFYLENETAAHKISDAGLKRFEQEHSLKQRFERISEIIKDISA